VVGGAACDDHDTAHAPDQRLVERAVLVQPHPVAGGGAIGDRVGDHVGLLVDLLEHVGLIAALLGCVLVPVKGLDGPLQLLAERSGDRDPLGAQRDDLVVVQELDLPGVCEERRHGRGQELLVLAPPHDQRALSAGAHERVGLVQAHRHERVVALQLAVGGAHRGGQVPLVVARDEVGDRLGVGLGGEHAALGEQPLLEGHVVLDDPVHHHMHPIAGIAVRVGVALADAPVRRPPRVPDARGRGPARHRDRASILVHSRMPAHGRVPARDRASIAVRGPIPAHGRIPARGRLRPGPDEEVAVQLDL
jgi:hypothetical protein